MKNDFDFIKEKFDENDVKAPEELNEEFVKEQIRDIEPLKEQKSDKRFVVRISIAAVISALLVNAIMIAGVFGIFKMLPVNITSPFGTAKTGYVSAAKLKTFGSKEEVKKELSEIFEKEKEYRNEYSKYFDHLDEYYSDNPKIFSSDTAPESGASGGSGLGSLNGSYHTESEPSYHNDTYIQTTGVDEADRVKTDGKYIFNLNSDSYSLPAIEIYSADNGKTALAAKIKAPNHIDVFTDFYIRDNKLIAMSNSSYGTDATTKVLIYNISDIKNIRLCNSFSQSGDYCSSRLIDNMLYVVSTQETYQSDQYPFCCNGATDDEADKTELPADCIYSVENPSNSYFLVVSAIDTEKNGQDVISKAILGSANDIYCNTENLYIFSREYGETGFRFRTGGSYSIENDTYETSYTQIVKVRLNEKIDFTATSRVKGDVNNQYALDEKDGNLRVAATSMNARGKNINNLYVLDNNLKEIGSVTGFAENESIKAVRYINDTAYVITYEQTDPLFVIDLSDPRDPEITGHVKISGFSTLLVPVDENTLLGIGYQTDDPGIIGEAENGLKLVTFDISDKAQPKIIDTEIFEDTSSPVQNFPKALLVNFERGDYTIPYNYDHIHWSELEENYSDYIARDAYSGILNFRIDKGNIDIIDKYVSDKFGKDEENGYIDRCVYIGDYIYMVGINNPNPGYYESYAPDAYNADYKDSYETVIDSVKYK